jgi:protein phosphatase
MTIMRIAGIGLEVYGRTDVGRARHTNEDAFVVADLAASHPLHAMTRPLDIAVGPHGVLLVVSDGIDGAQAGAIAGALTLRALRREPSTEREIAETTLAASAERANRCGWDTSSAEKRGTLTSVFIVGDRAFVAEVGRPHAFLRRGRRLVELAHENSRLELPLDAGNLSREESATFEHENLVAHSIGRDVRVTLNSCELHRGDQLLLCSDGLSNNVRQEELASIMSSTTIPDVISSRLIELANARGGEDNVTVVVAEMWGERLREPRASERTAWRLPNRARQSMLR